MAIDVTDDKCALAKSLGADHVINGITTPAVEAVRELSRGGVHVSMDALGSAATCRDSILSLRKGGKHLQVGLLPATAGKHPEIPMDLVIANELRLIGSHGMQAHRYESIFRLLENKAITLEQLITKTISLEEVPDELTQLNLDTTPGISVITMF
jgi:alcohol dehydrogenase